MRHLAWFSSLALALALSIPACSPVTSARIAQADVPRQMQPDIPNGTVAQLAASNNAFALDLYRSLRTNEGNLVFSPFSISLALAMPYAGARGETQSQMAKALHFDLAGDDLAAAFNAMDLALTQQARQGSGGAQSMQLDIANAAWADQGTSFLSQYLETLARNYGAGIQLADFIHQPDAARQEINSWVEQKTQRNIRNLIPPGAVGTMTRFVLVNAIYFKADWQTPFDPNDTKPGEFTRLDGSRIQAQMLSNSGLTAPYAAGSDWQAVELLYDGGTAALDVIVPDPGSFSTFESRFDASVLSQILASLQPTSVNLQIPKYRFGAHFDLGDQLSGLGMSDALDPDRADFSGITGGRDLFISKVLHQAMIAVDEQGTEAAAATSVIMGPTLALRANATLQVDRPFVFAIRDLSSGQILFLGRVLDPTIP